MRSKTSNDNYYLLTMAAIAQEIRYRRGERKTDVVLAAGLPLASFGREKKGFREYLFRKEQPLRFRYEDESYEIRIQDVKLFPQGYSALALHPECVRDEPSVLLADIGGWTVDLMRLDNSVPNAATCRSLELGVMYGYQFYNMQLAARDNGWTPFSAMENHYNLLYREDERELLPICKQMKVSLMPYSPLAAGHLARPQWKSESLRGTTDRVAMGKYDKTEAEDMQIVKRVAELAEKYNCKMSQIAIAWQWAKGILSPIIGATKTQYLDDSAGAFDIKLTAEDLAYLEEPYVPHEIVGAIDKNPAQGVILLDEKK